MFEDIDGWAPAQPWQQRELTRVLEAVTGLAKALSPAPIAVPAVEDRFRFLGRGWQQLADAADQCSDDLTGLHPWARDRLGRLVIVEEGWSAAARGGALVHADIRADNILLTRDRVYFVDWPWACLAASWFDLVAMLPSVKLQGGPQPEQILSKHPVAASADPDAVTAVLCALAGVFTYLSRQPDPPGLPTLRAFQRAQGEVALDWLRQRTGWH
jgi:Ser/Thr protein kinase RdoA (MazF antagonist)